MLMQVHELDIPNTPNTLRKLRGYTLGSEWIPTQTNVPNVAKLSELQPCSKGTLREKPCATPS